MNKLAKLKEQLAEAIEERNQLDSYIANLVGNIQREEAEQEKGTDNK